MGETGILADDPRIGLIAGQIVVREPIGAHHAGPIATDVLLLIEVADASVRLDRRVRIPRYARAGRVRRSRICSGEACSDVRQGGRIHRVEREGIAVALAGDLTAGREERRGLGLPARGLGDNHLATAADPQKGGGHARRGAEGRVVHPEVHADRADRHRAGMGADPHAEIHPVEAAGLVGHGHQSLEDLPPGRDGIVGPIEQRHRPVAEELVDGAALSMDRVQDHGERPLHEAEDVLGSSRSDMAV